MGLQWDGHDSSGESGSCSFLSHNLTMVSYAGCSVKLIVGSAEVLLQLIPSQR